MDIILVLIVAGGVVSAIKGFVWLIEAMKDGKITLLETLSLIEYQFSIIFNLIWMYAIYTAFTRQTIEPVATSIVTATGVLTVFSFALFLSSMYYLARGKPTMSFLMSGLALLLQVNVGLIPTAEVPTLLFQLLVLILIIDALLLTTLKPYFSRPR